MYAENLDVFLGEVVNHQVSDLAVYVHQPKGLEGIKRAQAEGKYKGRVPTAMKQADKVKALVEAGVTRVQVQEQLGISKASYYRCLKTRPISVLS